MKRPDHGPAFIPSAMKPFMHVEMFQAAADSSADRGNGELTWLQA